MDPAGAQIAKSAIAQLEEAIKVLEEMGDLKKKHFLSLSCNDHPAFVDAAEVYSVIGDTDGGSIVNIFGQPPIKVDQHSAAIMELMYAVKAGGAS